MATNGLKKRLTSLHEDLQAVNQIDPELEELLEQLNHDIRLLLDKNTRVMQVNALAERLRGYAARFAAQHPTIDATLREIADDLGRMGI